MFGKERLKKVIRANSSRTSEEIIQALEQALIEFRGDAEQLDDITIAVVKTA